MSDSFAGQAALITGAARGFGRATAEYFLARGAQVAVHVRTAQRAQSLADELGDHARAVGGDLADPISALSSGFKIQPSSQAIFRALYFHNSVSR